LAEACALSSASFWLVLIFAAIVVSYNNRIYIVVQNCALFIFLNKFVKNQHILIIISGIPPLE